jgi:site-specific recombinase XerD
VTATTVAPAAALAVAVAPAPSRRVRAGGLDLSTIARVLAALPFVAGWPQDRKRAQRLVLNASQMLDWLGSLAPGGWQSRWEHAEQVYGPKWRTWPIMGRKADGRPDDGSRSDLTRGLGYLIKLRLIRPSYAFLSQSAPPGLLAWMRSAVSPELFARVEDSARVRGLSTGQTVRALNTLAAIVIHGGGGLTDITAEDLLMYHQVVSRHGLMAGSHAAWQMLADLGVFPAGTTLHAALQAGQLTTTQIVDRYQITNDSVRGLLIRYLDERRPGVDFSTFRKLANILAGSFWADIEQHHPEVNDINLPGDVAQAWKQRIRAKPPRRAGSTMRHFDIFIVVRAFYQDIAEWALSDPSWAEWAVPSPIRKSDTEGSDKHAKARTAAMHQRTRERLPHLLRLVDSAERCRHDRAALLAAAIGTAIGATAEHAGITYRRVSPDRPPRPRNQRTNHVLVEDLADGSLTNLTIAEDETFWAWAVIETLRHTGIRVEELVELTQFAIVSHRLADTGELIPLLQIVPSKTNQERLLLVTPELASVLAAIISRIRNSDGTVPLVARYDQHERVTGPELPHLFQHHDGFHHSNGWRNDVLTTGLVRTLLTRALARSGISDATGQPLRYTPHDFRRMFATEAVTGGLPIHIAARVLGHANINTTQSYTAVYQDELIRAYRAFVDRRRAVRPSDEYRAPTEAEWAEFQQHFHLRKIELGDCGRPYGTPCAHEHACVRCPMLRVDPRQRTRLIEIVRNLAERIREAKANGWHGEVEGLTVSLTAAEAKLAGLDRAARNHPGPMLLGLPSGTLP